MKNSQVSFGTNIILRDMSGFLRETSHIKTSINRPHTWHQIIRAPEIVTTDIFTCSAGGILTMNKDFPEVYDLVGDHIDPARFSNKKFSHIKDKLYKELGNSKPIKAFLFGCKSFTDFSLEQFNRFEEFFEKELGIPVSKIKGTFGNTTLSFSFNGYKDECNLWTSAENIMGRKILPEDVPKIFPEMKICSQDTFTIDPYAFENQRFLTEEQLRYA